MSSARCALTTAAMSVAAALCLSAQSPDQAPVASFRASADLVAVEVNVRRNFAPVADLKPEEFEVVDNGVAQQVAGLSYGKLPIDMTVALDVSASVEGPSLAQLRQGVLQLLPDLGPEDRLKLMTFNMRVRRVVDLGRSPDAVSAALNQLRGTGSTAIFDTIAVALTTPVDPDRRHLILVFSDGADSSSTKSIDTLIDVIHRTRPTVGFVLSVAPARPTTWGATSAAGSPFVPRQIYDRLARESGGAVVSDARNPGEAFRRLLDEFRTSYVVYYRPTGVARTGLHTIDVRVKRALANVKARRSYDW